MNADASPPPPSPPAPDINLDIDINTASVMLGAAVTQIRFAREYLHSLLQATPQDRWFEIPDGLPTNVAWQVGHLCVAQYGLLLFRLRGRAEEDLELIPSRFRKAYGKGSTPKADPAKQPSPDELTGRLDRVLSLGLETVANLDRADLLDPMDAPYAGYPNKLGAILFCPLHEHIHAGQIGLIRRALGLEPVR